MMRFQKILICMVLSIVCAQTPAAGRRWQDPPEQIPKPADPELGEIEVLSKKFFGALRTGSLTAVNDTIRGDWAAEPSSSIGIGSGLSNFLNSAGPMTRYWVVRIQSVSDLLNDSGLRQASFYQVKYLCYHEARPSAWQIEFVKWRDKMRIFRVDVETEFIFDFLTRSPLEVRALRAQAGLTLLRRP